MLDKNKQHQEKHKIEAKTSNEEIIKILMDCVRLLVRQDLPFHGTCR